MEKASQALIGAGFNRLHAFWAYCLLYSDLLFPANYVTDSVTLRPPPYSRHSTLPSIDISTASDTPAPSLPVYTLPSSPQPGTNTGHPQSICRFIRLRIKFQLGMEFGKSNGKPDTGAIGKQAFQTKSSPAITYPVISFLKHRY